MRAARLVYEHRDFLPALHREVFRRCRSFETLQKRPWQQTEHALGLRADTRHAFRAPGTSGFGR